MAYIDHIHIRASDPAKTIEFFRNYFGARIEREFESLGRRITLMEVGDKSNLSILHQTPVTENPRPEAASIDHIGIVVENIDTVVSRIKEEGYEFSLDIRETATGSKIAFCLGPDNVYLEIIQRP